jgi:hypothetical protein
LTGTSVRDLDGRRWVVVHEVWEQAQLVEALGALGWVTEPLALDGDQFPWMLARLSSS